MTTARANVSWMNRSDRGRRKLLWAGLRLPQGGGLTSSIEILSGAHPQLVVEGLEGRTVAFDRLEFGCRMRTLAEEFGDEAVTADVDAAALA
jgi:hypothetical protein